MSKINDWFEEHYVLMETWGAASIQVLYERKRFFIFENTPVFQKITALKARGSAITHFWIYLTGIMMTPGYSAGKYSRLILQVNSG